MLTTGPASLVTPPSLVGAGFPARGGVEDPVPADPGTGGAGLAAEPAIEPPMPAGVIAMPAFGAGGGIANMPASGTEAIVPATPCGATPASPEIVTGPEVEPAFGVGAERPPGTIPEPAALTESTRDGSYSSQTPE
jgi:hypothetical protein